MDYFKRASQFASEHNSLVSILAAVTPFIYASVATMFLTNGDNQAANYIFQTFGLFNIWVTGVVDILHVIFGLGVASFLIIYFKKFISLENTEGYFNFYYGAILAIFLTTASMSIVIGSAIGLIVGYIRRKQGKKTAAQINPRGYFLFFGAVILYFSIANFPNVPYTKLSVENNKIIVGKLVSDKNNQEVLIDDKSNKIYVIEDQQIKKTEICSRDKSWLSDPIIGLVRKEKLVNKC